MRNLLLVLLFLIASCSNNKEDIKVVESFLDTTIPVNNINVKSSSEGIKQYIRIIDITMNKKDFSLLIKKIDLKGFEKYGNNYYKNSFIEKEDKKIYLTLYPNEFRIRYTEKE